MEKADEGPLVADAAAALFRAAGLLVWSQRRSLQPRRSVGPRAASYCSGLAAEYLKSLAAL